MNYSKKLQHIKWQMKRLNIFHDRGWMCEICKRGEFDDITIHLHHKQYDYGKDPWDYEDSNFRVLCGDCHRNLHGDKELLSFEERFNKETERKLKEWRSTDEFKEAKKRYEESKSNPI